MRCRVVFIGGSAASHPVFLSGCKPWLLGGRCQWLARVERRPLCAAVLWVFVGGSAASHPYFFLPVLARQFAQILPASPTAGTGTHDRECAVSINQTAAPPAVPLLMRRKRQPPRCHKATGRLPVHKKSDPLPSRFSQPGRGCSLVVLDFCHHSQMQLV